MRFAAMPRSNRTRAQKLMHRVQLPRKAFAGHRRRGSEANIEHFA